MIEGKTTCQWMDTTFTITLKSVFRSEIGCQFLKSDAFFGYRVIIPLFCSIDSFPWDISYFELKDF